MPCATCMMLFKFERSQTILYTDLDLHADSSKIGTVTVDSLLKCELIKIYSVADAVDSVLKCKLESCLQVDCCNLGYGV